MKARLSLLVLMSVLSFSVFAQNLDDDPEFGAIKAEFLMKKGRFEEAVRVLNDVLKKDPENPTYLLIRAEAKYALGAYKGAKKDAMSYIEVAGINERLCYIMGRTELAMGNSFAALGYFDAAIQWNKNVAEYYLERGNVHWEMEDEESACSDWHVALRMGSDEAAYKARSYCPRVRIPIKDKPSQKDEEDSYDPQTDDSSDQEQDPYNNPDDDVTEKNDPMDDTYDNADDEEESVPVEPVDNTINKIYIDEDLTLEIRDGIGSREIRELPDMLILSDNSGIVAVDICVDKFGQVDKAEVNRDKSTIYTASLVNLALRKSKEIYFERSWKKEQCGSIYFRIKGSE